MASTINLGDAFLLETPPNGMHLYIAIAPTSDDTYLFVNTTTCRPNSDTSCVLKPGPGIPSFIVQESVISYKFAREIDAVTINTLIAKGVCKPRGNCSPTVLLQIQQGGLISKQLKNKYKTILKSFLGRL